MGSRPIIVTIHDDGYTIGYLHPRRAAHDGHDGGWIAIRLSAPPFTCNLRAAHDEHVVELPTRVGRQQATHEQQAAHHFP